jgi:N-alpha-acetyltransferase 35, NatC auxiliary subunit
MSPETHITDATELWDLVQTHIQMIQSSHHIGVGVPQSFSTKLQRRLASAVPPRPIVQFTFEDAMGKFIQFCEDCKEGIRIAGLQPTTPAMTLVSLER